MNGASELHAKTKETVRYSDYHDHSDVSNEWVEQQRQELGVSTESKAKFPELLHRMLEVVDATEHSFVIRWLPHGRAFSVYDKVRFENEVLPLHFPRQHKLASFQRQMSFYGFRRLIRGNAYYHELFLRGRSAMAALIPRITVASYSSRRRYDPSSEPDLCAMRWLTDVATTVSTGATRSNLARLPSSMIPHPGRKQPISNDHRSAFPANAIRQGAKMHTTNDGSGYSETVATATDGMDPWHNLPPASSAPRFAHGPVNAACTGGNDVAMYLPLWQYCEPSNGSRQLDVFRSNSHVCGTPPLMRLASCSDQTAVSRSNIHDYIALSMVDGQGFDNNQVDMLQGPSSAIMTMPLGNGRHDRESRGKMGSFDVSRDESDRQEVTATREDDMTSLEIHNHEKLVEWMNFLDDVDLDS